MLQRAASNYQMLISSGLFLAFHSVLYQAIILLFVSYVDWIRDEHKHRKFNSIYTLLKMVGDIYQSKFFIHL